MGRGKELNCTVTFLVSTKDINSAAFNRFISIAKASSTLNNVRIIGLRSSNNKKEVESILNPITEDLFFYGYKKSKSKILNLLKSYRTVRRQLKKVTKEGTKKEILFIYSTNVIDYLFYFFLSKRLKFKYATERNEFPHLVRETVPLKSFLYKALILPWTYKLFDGIILMTDPLIKFYRPYLRNEAQVLKVPMTVDFDRFTAKKKPSEIEENNKYIFYAGSLSQKKDGIETLIESFTIAKKHVVSLKLIIAGGSQNQIAQLKNKFDLHSESSIEFLGMVERNKIPELIMEASLLVLPRPKSKQAEGGFPTKLGEYLASGNPVIATPVGDIPKYLTDNKDVKFCHELLPKSFAECIINVFDDYENFKTIGKNGQSTASKYFNLNNYTKNLDDFFMKV